LYYRHARANTNDDWQIAVAAGKHAKARMGSLTIMGQSAAAGAGRIT